MVSLHHLKSKPVICVRLTPVPPEKEMRSKMSFELYTYLMYTPVVFNLLFAQVHPPKITIPAKSRELRQKQQVSRDYFRFKIVSVFGYGTIKIMRDIHGVKCLSSSQAPLDLQPTPS